jgi:hypothetical protein
MNLKRDLRLDFVRGLALICLAIDHIPFNFFSAFTLRSLMLSDAAEIFVFVSGVTATVGFGKILVTRGPRPWLQRIGRRIAQLYAAHLFLIALAVAMFWTSMQVLGRPGSWSATPLAALVEGGFTAWLDAALLRLQPELVDILPLYIVLLALLPIIHLAARWDSRITLALSGIVWLAAAQLGGGKEGGWYFNPFAWQFLFTIGVVCGLAMGRRPRTMHVTPLAVAAMLYLALGLLAVAPWTQIPGLESWRLLPAGWMGAHAKSNLSVWRLTSLLAAAYLFARYVPPAAGWMQSRALGPIHTIGRNGLPAVSVATAVCYMAYVARVDGARGPAYQLGFNALALLSMWGFAAFLEWKERRQAETRRPAGAKARTADMPSASAGALT